MTQPSVFDKTVALVYFAHLSTFAVINLSFKHLLHPGVGAASRCQMNKCEISAVDNFSVKISHLASDSGLNEILLLNEHNRMNEAHKGRTLKRLW